MRTSKLNPAKLLAKKNGYTKWELALLFRTTPNVINGWLSSLKSGRGINSSSVGYFVEQVKTETRYVFKKATLKEVKK